MKVLLVGSGGREHALAWKLAQSPLLGKLWATPGNPGIAQHAECVALNLSDHQAVIGFCRENGVDLVVIGPEQPLVEGLADALEAAGVKAFGPSAQAAQLEGSKGFTKDLCKQAGIPTAAYARFDNANAAIDYVYGQPMPIVIKADGLAAGKGVVIAVTPEDAADAVTMMFDGGFGAAGAEVVVEEFMQGEEASLFAITDGTTVLPLGSAQDHKRVGDGDTGPNTGGMGAYSPARVLTPALEAQAIREIIQPTVEAMAARGTPSRGILYAGLMLTEDGPKLIEYNVRFGDPECQVLMMRLESDLLALIDAACTGRLAEVEPKWRDEAALTVVMAAEGYPGTPVKGTVIHGVERAQAQGTQVFHAGTSRSAAGDLVASGGRVLNITALGENVAEAQALAYRGVDAIEWPHGFCRRDIGWREVAREQGRG